jgi:hypothetical protein
MSNKTIEFRFSSYSDDPKILEPSDVTYTLPLTEDADFTELQKHFRRFLKSIGVQ